MSRSPDSYQIDFLNVLDRFNRSNDCFDISRLIRAIIADALHLELGRIAEQEKALKDRKRIISSVLGGLK